MVYFFLDKKNLITPLYFGLVFLFLTFVITYIFRPCYERYIFKRVLIYNIIFNVVSIVVFYSTNKEKLIKEYHISKNKELIYQKPTKKNVLGKPYFVRNSDKEIEAFYKNKDLNYWVLFSIQDSIIKHIEVIY